MIHQDLVGHGGMGKVWYRVLVGVGRYQESLIHVTCLVLDWGLGRIRRRQGFPIHDACAALNEEWVRGKR